MTPPADVSNQGDEEMVAKNGTATRNRTAETARASAVGEVGQEEVDSSLRGYVTPRAISDCGSNGALSL